MMLIRASVSNGAFLLAEETAEWLDNFSAFLERFRKLRMRCEVLGQGTLSPIVPDHFVREQTHFVSKIKAYLDSIKGDQFV